MYCFSKCCRLCLTKNNLLADIKCCGSDGIPFYDKLELLAPSLVANPNDYKTWICEQCRNRLKEAYSFVQHCYKIDAVLNEYCKQLTSPETAQNNCTETEGLINQLIENLIKESIPILVKEECFEDLTTIDDEYYFENTIPIEAHEGPPVDFEFLQLEPSELRQETSETGLNFGDASNEQNMVLESSRDPIENVQIDPIAGTSGEKNILFKEKCFEDLSAIDEDQYNFESIITIEKHEVSSADFEIKLESSELKQEAGETGLNVGDASNEEIMVSESNRDLIEEEKVQIDPIAGTSGENNILSCSAVPNDAEDDAKICNRNTSNSLTEHRSINKRKCINKRFICGTCNKIFSRSDNLKKHERVHTGERPYKCQICNMKFARTATLKQHERIHSEERPFKCKICEKTFTQSSTLKHHEKIHSSERRFKCDICEKAFTQSGSLKGHQRLHSGERPFKCKVCERTFTVSGHLKVHERIHSGERPFKCSICNKAYIQSISLQNHQRFHNGESPFKCKICEKTFTQSYSLKFHQRLHTGERPFKCKVCNKTFTRSSSLKRHESVHNSDVF